MAKKKKPQSRPSAKEFSNSPFKSLKGLSDLETNEKNTHCSDADSNQAGLSNDQEKKNPSFSDEMDFLGVQPLLHRSVEKAETEPTAESDKAGGAVSEQEEFLAAIGSIKKVFKDEWQNGETDKRAGGRRIRKVKKGQLKPQDKLDLHGLTVAEATAKVSYFLQNSIYKGFTTVMIVTGKGLHSDEGPVLRKAVEGLLNELPELVVEWNIAPQRYGGSGALLIFLRHKTKK